MAARATIAVLHLLLAGLFAGCPTTVPPEEPPKKPACRAHSECGASQVCVAELCEEAPPCSHPEDWPYCVGALNALAPDLGRYATCDGERCRPACLVDEECAGDALCTDFGRCTPTRLMAAEKPKGRPPSPLRAGFGEALLDFPIGVSLGGYGSRAHPGDGRYAKGLRPSVGQLHGLYARALALDTGEAELLLVRVPLIFIGMAFHEEVARILEEETGLDWRDSLILSATHTHSGPARHWPLPPDPYLPIGSFGIGDFSQGIHDALVRSTAEAALAAREARAPARLGWHIEEAFDVEDRIAQDRRLESPPFDDNRALLIRVDDEQGVPRAVIISYGVHGTTNGTDYASGDVIAGAERGLEAALSERFGRFVPVLFVNQNSGTMSPGSDGGHDFPQSLERAGPVVAEALLDPILSVETSSEITLSSRTHRFYVTLERLGYERGEWASERELPFGGEVHYGGLNCLAHFTADAAFETYLDPSDKRCLGMHTILHNRPPTELLRSQITALDLDGLTVVTAPGELSMELSWLVLRALRDRHGVSPLAAFTWGYAQDHLLYLLPERVDGELPPFPGISTPQAPGDFPPFAFSYLRGGYEASMSTWGERLGDFLVEKSVEAYALLVGEAVPDLESVAPLAFSPIKEAPVPVEPTPPERLGAVVEDMPERLLRLEAAELAWVGGDPGAERPQAPLVVLEREGPGGFAPVMTSSHRPYSNREPLLVTRVRQRGDEWQWVVRFEETKAFPTGRYRLAVRGHAATPDGEIVPYALASRTFELAPREDLLVTVAAMREVEAEPPRISVEGTLAYPPGARVSLLDLDDDPGALAGNHRLRDVDVPVHQPAPVRFPDDVEPAGVRVVLKGAGGEVLRGSPNFLSLQTGPDPAAGGLVITRYVATFDDVDPMAGPYEVEVTLEDSYGNRGMGTSGVAEP